MGSVRQATLVPLPVCLWPDLTSRQPPHVAMQTTQRQTDRQTASLCLSSARQTFWHPPNSQLCKSSYLFPLSSFCFLLHYSLPLSISSTYLFFFFLPVRFKPVLTLPTWPNISPRYSFQWTKARMWLYVGWDHWKQPHGRVPSKYNDSCNTSNPHNLRYISN